MQARELVLMTNSELQIIGQGVSRGTALGKAVCLFGRRRQYFRIKIDDTQIDKELRRLKAAVRLAIRQLGRLSPKHTNESLAGIIDTHKLMMSDPAMLGEIEQKIIDEKINAEWAVKLITDGYLAQYKSIPDERFRERQADLEDITERLLIALGGGSRSHMILDQGSIIVSHELSPSTLIELAEQKPAGIITEHGGWTSHTFILARELGIPAVTGVRRPVRRIRNGDDILVNGFRGEVIVRPSGETLKTFSFTEATDGVGRDKRAGPEHSTVDGRKITIRANADIPGGFEKARDLGAKGIGLLRSEYTFNRYKGIPSEEEQFEAYRHIAQLAGDDGVRIRTFDFGSDEVAEQTSPKQKNPALGLRAIRLSMEHERKFREQLRALLRASYETNIDVILPMISDVAEVVRVKELLSQERINLAEANIPFGSPRVGVMVEVPSAVFMIREILDEVDTICLGTNDLVQYLLAVDRDNESVASWFRTLNPSVIRAVKEVVEACRERNIACVVCGEMAGSPYYVPILIGLGATELSMNPSSIPRIRSLVSGIAYQETLKLLGLIEKCRSASEVEEVNRDFISTNWSHLYEIETST